MNESLPPAWAAEFAVTFPFLKAAQALKRADEREGVEGIELRHERVKADGIELHVAQRAKVHPSSCCTGGFNLTFRTY